MADFTPFRLTEKHLDATKQLLARAFVGDPVAVHMYPDAERRAQCFAETAGCVCRYGLMCGELQATSPDLEGVALWFPPGKIDASLWTQIRAGFFNLPFHLGIRSFRRVLDYANLTAAMRKRHLRGPHWYLQFLAVDPSHQGQGHGGRLLRSMLARLDREGAPCCLDTEKPKNVAMYGHFGFRTLESALLPRSNCTVWFLARDVQKI
jgi:ribosomal protein S18 acetylase RimI-like enzyme